MTTFDLEDESVLSSIFKDAFPDTWRNSADFAQYLSDLCSFGVEKLNREPSRLAEERTQILEQTQNLAFHNYKTFIETAECSREIFQDFQIIETHVEEMLNKVPELVQTCNSFTKQAQQINASRRMNNVTLQRNTQLLEILEMPQLMDTCVRNGYYEEALELASHVKRLEKKHGSIPIIMRIVNDIKVCSQLMLNQLIQQLRSNVQLPACLKVIGYLRRMHVFSEPELRIKFLQARDAWFQSILSVIPNDDPYYHVTKTIEASRVHLFDIITQYRAVFSDDDPILSHSKDAQSDAVLFHGWLIQKVSQFLSVLEADLSRGMGARLDSLLGQCMYFGLSFSRVGADFRSLLAPIFQRAALTSFRAAVNEANERFDEEMQSFTLLGNCNVFVSSAYTLASQQSSDGLQPPVSLLQFQPLAAYCNALLTAFNELRLCSPLSLAGDIASTLTQSLTNAALVILAYHRAEETTFNEEEKSRFAEICHVFCHDLLPYINTCQRYVFPPTVIAQTLGITIAHLNKLGNVGSLNIDDICEPLRFLTPAKISNETIVDETQPPSTVTIPGNHSSVPASDSIKLTTTHTLQGTNDKNQETDSTAHDQDNKADATGSAGHSDQTDAVATDSAGHSDQTDAVATDSAGHSDQTDAVTTDSAGHSDPTDAVATDSAGHSDQPDAVATDSAGHSDQTDAVATGSAGHSDQPDAVATDSAGHSDQTDAVTADSTAQNDKIDADKTDSTAQNYKTDPDSTDSSAQNNETDAVATDFTVPNDMKTAVLKDTTIEEATIGVSEKVTLEDVQPAVHSELGNET